MKQLKPRYHVVVNGQSNLFEVECEDGTLMDNLPSMEVAKLIAQLAELGHLFRDYDSAVLFLLEQPLSDGMEVTTLEDWAESSIEDDLEGLRSDDGPVTHTVDNQVEEEQPSLPVQKVGV